MRPEARSSKPLKGLGSGVLEVVSDYRGDTFRSVYTVRFADRVFVLHAFQKKSKSGVATPKADIDLIKQRLKQAIDLAGRRSRPMARKDYIVGSGNVFEDLGHPRPAEALAKADSPARSPS